MSTPTSLVETLALENASFIGQTASTFSSGIVPIREAMLAAIEQLKTNPSDPHLLAQVQRYSADFAIINSTMSGLMNAFKQTALGIANHMS
ncbi:hypothetical protein [Pararobbsia silviterrae]|uniref:EscF/YscF/HrpA family type III secretion system needle major subunit n=1 Tax=Pararobbsia silviterrae TaxID=1792498 RepID=A0A494XS18_9BURK|nr:hypothetical protein [Pararobbsia silviterrae]RKP50333.1 hypothetical protein D7S86_19710 [Pararobbsia silviterrae]